MKLKAYSIRDAKAEIYNLPFYKQTHGEAERDFRTLVNDEKSTVSKYSEDFDLFYIGDYDDNLGLFTSLETPQHVIKAIHVKTQTTQ